MTQALHEVSTRDLVAELKRRNAALLICGLRVEEHGEAWIREAKGTNAILNQLLRVSACHVDDIVIRRRNAGMTDFDTTEPPEVGGKQGAPKPS